MSYNRNTSRHNRRTADGGWVHTLLFYILPFIIINTIIFFCVTTRPKVTISVADTNDYLTTEATVTIKSWLPTKDITFSMDNEPLEAKKGKKSTYTLSIVKNGVIEVSAKSINGMSTPMFEQVNILDDNLPSIEDASIEDGIVTLTISDNQSGVNFDSIYALDSNNQRVAPFDVDHATATLSFAMDPEGLHVYAQDNAGNEVQGTFTSRKEGGVETLEGGEDTPAEEVAPTESAVIIE